MKRPDLPRLQWKKNRRTGIEEPVHRTTWFENGKRRERVISLDWQGNPRTLLDLYWECESGRHPRQKQPAKYTWAKLVSTWRGDPREKSRLKPSTLKAYNRRIEKILAKNGDKDMRRTTRAHVRTIHDDMRDTPREADWMVQIVSKLWNYAKLKQDWPLGDNPAQAFDLYGTQKPFEPWPDWMIAKLSTAPQDVQTVTELILGCGERPSAAVDKEWSAFRGDFMLAYDQKGGEQFEVAIPARLRAYIDRLPKNGRHLLARDLTTPLGYDAVEKQFRRWRKGLGAAALAYSLHGLRKLAIIQLAESGCSDAEIQSLTNQSMETIAYYRKRASRKKLSLAAQRRREQNTDRT